MLRIGRYHLSRSVTRLHLSGDSLHTCCKSLDPHLLLLKILLLLRINCDGLEPSEFLPTVARGTDC